MPETEPLRMRPVFIGGCMRSGTTLLGSVLGGHSQMTCIPEARFIVEIYLDYLQHRNLHKAWRDIRNSRQFIKQWAFSQQEIRSVDQKMDRTADYRILIEHIISVYSERSKKSDCVCWVDHTTKNIMQAPILLEIFPEAKFIHIIRDGRAAANSMLQVRFGPDTIYHAAKKWAYEVACNYAVQQVINQPSLFFNVRYELFVTEPEDRIQALLHHVSLPFEPLLTEKQDYAVPANNMSSHSLVGKPPDLSRINSWQQELSPSEIKIFEKQARDILMLTGYLPVASPSPRFTSLQKMRWIVLAGLSRYFQKRICRHRLSGGSKHKRAYKSGVYSG